MNSTIRIFAALCVVPFALASFESCAQATSPPDEAKKAPAKAEPAKKADSTKTPVDAKKPATKPAPKKPAPKKPGAIKAPVKQQPIKTPAKAPATSANPNVTVLKSGQRTPILRDKDGNVIPTSPDAYDVSSATGKK
jgi:hypothetical protein